MTGRLGADAPVDFIIASLTSGVGFLIIPMVRSFSRSDSSEMSLNSLIFDSNAVPPLHSPIRCFLHRSPDRPPHSPHFRLSHFLHSPKLVTLRCYSSQTNLRPTHGEHLDRTLRVPPSCRKYRWEPILGFGQERYGRFNSSWSSTRAYGRKRFECGLGYHVSIALSTSRYESLS